MSFISNILKRETDSQDMYQFQILFPKISQYLAFFPAGCYVLEKYPHLLMLLWNGSFLTANIKLCLKTLLLESESICMDKT